MSLGSDKCYIAIRLCYVACSAYERKFPRNARWTEMFEAFKALLKYVERIQDRSNQHPKWQNLSMTSGYKLFYHSVFLFLSPFMCVCVYLKLHKKIEICIRLRSISNLKIKVYMSMPLFFNCVVHLPKVQR